jgi:hypothetical protein
MWSVVTNTNAKWDSTVSSALEGRRGEPVLAVTFNGELSNVEICHCHPVSGSFSPILSPSRYRMYWNMLTFYLHGTKREVAYLYRCIWATANPQRDLSSPNIIRLSFLHVLYYCNGGRICALHTLEIECLLQKTIVLLYLYKPSIIPVYAETETQIRGSFLDLYSYCCR